MPETVKYYEDDKEVLTELPDEDDGLLLSVQAENHTPLQEATPMLIFAGMLFGTIIAIVWAVASRF